MRFNSTPSQCVFAGFLLLASAATVAQAGNPEEQAYRTVYGPGFNAGLGMYATAMGDINDDGVPDYAISMRNGNGLGGAVRLFSGIDGAEIRTLVGVSTINFFGMGVAAAGDIDHDGVEDLIIGSPLELSINWNSSPPSIYGLASGVQTFSGKTGVRLVRVAQDVGEQWRDGLGWSVAAAGDLNGDGTPDFLAAAPLWSNYKGRVFGYSGTDGASLYNQAPTGTAGEFGFSLANLGDLNGDGFDDIVAGSPDSCKATVLNTHNNTVIRNINLGSTGGFMGDSVANAGDLNGDGVNELIVGGKNAARAVVYDGATWQILYDWHGAANSHFGYSVANAGDFNGDGVNDIAVGAPDFKRGFTTYGRAYVYSGASGGLLFSFEGAAGVPYFGMALAGVGDINSDGFDDLLVGAPGYHLSEDHGGAAYLYSGGVPETGFSSPSFYYTKTSTPTAVLVADINHDGFAAVVSVNATTGKMSVQKNNRDGTFVVAKLYDAGKGPNSLIAADLDNDGDMDIVVTASNEKKLIFFRNNGPNYKLTIDGTLTVASKPTSIVAADFNHDGFMDLAVATKGAATLSVMLNNRNPIQRFQKRFASIKTLAVGAGAVHLQTADMNGDGFADLVLANATTNEISVMLNKARSDGKFFPRTVVATPHAPINLALADLNHDHLLDIACICTGDDHVSIYSSLGDKTYALADSLAVGRGARTLIAGDFNADGLADLAVSNAIDNTVSLLMSGETNSFGPTEDFATHTNPVGIGCADIDGDGDQDIVTISGNTGWMSVLMNRWIY